MTPEPTISVAPIRELYHALAEQIVEAANKCAGCFLTAQCEATGIVNGQPFFRIYGLDLAPTRMRIVVKTAKDSAVVYEDANLDGQAELPAWLPFTPSPAQLEETQRGFVEAVKGVLSCSDEIKRAPTIAPLPKKTPS